ncbi:bifunctional alpha,alpha-trehalose-phosphate synthase (UDP-forming)/trehalose-phosphatase [Xylanimonas allomyrinae]|uniref:Bifunctional alpha,alpha-trehalose-phosphate synthase (UDP-forming)/trehalose-phosphatase n=1 Tax=Xylanimonas allomyrinae TaxID=2509459 RepID=A0A4V0YEB6_9MICO|nr:bifunctional alpha,alpha-trehalose-phosphate synthase (UDP-forming)/trehalose-phosphatase [Xylanimonas allomyrinae]QAY63641.1 bifunctional alpha,alpha-trehalose-phosphate synthase (UDP-forming)/trehalose-phosphatase [Xylanimonas allomyrinae]
MTGKEQTGRHDRYDLVVVANRLPVDFSVRPGGGVDWQRSPGGLVTALEPVMQHADGAWVGWSGAPDLASDPFDADGMRLVPVTLSESEIERYYEGFSNDTLWPLYHDVVSTPAYHRQWWDAYRRVNQRFAEAAAAQAADGAVVWVHDYQLQLVPRLLRELRPDLRIGFFDHIPFPPVELFQQLPWRRQIVEGLLGADLVGFQRGGDASNFIRAVRRLTDYTTRGPIVTMDEGRGRQSGTAARHVRAGAFPISIDATRFDALARTPEVQTRAKEIRAELGDPDVVMLGVDRLDYTKGIRHRIKAYGELLGDGRIDAARTTLVQVASPSRENVGAYQELRQQVEVLVGRINGEFGELGHSAIHYLHHSYPPEEMAALYLAADVMLVTSLRDGMNLVAKEYIAARSDEQGVLVLSEFTGAADELGAGPVLINPHDIEGTKDAIVTAARMTAREQRRRMRRLRRKVIADDVAKWSHTFLGVLQAMPRRTSPHAPAPAPSVGGGVSASLVHALDALATADGAAVLVGLDFDGTLAPLVDDPTASAMTPAARAAVDRLAALPGTRLRLALVSGRDLADLAERARPPAGTYLVGSHGAETGHVRPDGTIEAMPVDLTPEQSAALAAVAAGLEDIAAQTEGAWVQHKPSAAVLHTRLAEPAAAAAATARAREIVARLGLEAMHGKDVVEVAVLAADKGTALARLRDVVAREGDGGTRPVHVLYAGDDTTDEHAFRALGAGDVAVKVGEGATTAAHRVADADALAAALARLADATAWRSGEPLTGA